MPLLYVSPTWQPEEYGRCLHYQKNNLLLKKAKKYQKPLFYADKGRYEPHVARAMKNAGYRQAIHCARGESHRGKLWTEVDVLKQTSFLWLRNRAGFPAKLTQGGRILWNHIPNEYLLTKKHWLAQNLSRYIHEQGEALPERLRDIHPETFVLEKQGELEAFFEAIRTSEVKLNDMKSRGEQAPMDNTSLWIVKPVDSSGGNGISVIDSFKQFAHNYLSEDPLYLPRSAMIDPTTSLMMSAGSSTASSSMLGKREAKLALEYDVLIAGKAPETPEEALENPAAVKLCRSLIAQRYLGSPLLLNGHKFDIRAYMYVADVDPPLVFYHDGYLRVNIEPYDTKNLNNVWSHISNIGLQKIHPEYEDKKVESKWSFKTWQRHMLEKGLTNDSDWVTNVIKPQLRAIMEVAYRSVLPKFRQHGNHGCFALLGVDFIIDANHRAWLIEYTKTPAGHATLEPDDTLFEDMMDELIAMQLELQHSKPDTNGDSYPPDFKLTAQKSFVRIV